MLRKLSVLLIGISLIFSLVPEINAQTAGETNDTNLMLDEEVGAEDLEISEPKILPDSRLYLFKNFTRAIRRFFTFSSLAKAELNLRYASEKLIEAEKLARKGKKDLAEKVLERYSANFDKAKELLEKQKDNPRARKILEKLIDRGIKHQKVLSLIQKNLPLNKSGKIIGLKAKIAKRLGEFGEKDPEKLKEIIEKQKGSKFRNIKNIQVLLRVKEQVPEEAKDKIESVIENQLEKLKSDLEELAPEEREKVKSYLQNLSGNETRLLEVISRIENLDLPEKIQEKLGEAKEKVIERFENRLKKLDEQNLEDLKQELFKPLEEAELSKLKVTKELIKKLPVQRIERILPVEQKIKQKFAKKIEQLSAEKREEFVQRLGRYQDVQGLEILKEIEEFVPEEGKDVLKKARERIKTRIKNELEETSESDLGRKVQRIFKNRLEGLEIVEELPISSPVKEKTKKLLIKGIERKLQNVEDPEELNQIKQRLKARRAEIKSISPQFIEKLERAERTAEGRITKELVEKKIEQAKKMFSELKGKVEKLTDEQKQLLPRYLFLSLELIKKEINQSVSALEQGKVKVAFTTIQSVLGRIRSCFAMLLRSLTEVPLVPEKPQQPGKKIVCPALYDPVCGIDGITYPNRCVAERIHRVKVAYRGKCREQKLTCEQKCKILGYLKGTCRSYPIYPRARKCLENEIYVGSAVDCQADTSKLGIGYGCCCLIRKPQKKVIEVPKPGFISPEPVPVKELIPFFERPVSEPVEGEVKSIKKPTIKAEPIEKKLELEPESLLE